MLMLLLPTMTTVLVTMTMMDSNGHNNNDDNDDANDTVASATDEDNPTNIAPVALQRASRGQPLCGGQLPLSHWNA